MATTTLTTAGIVFTLLTLPLSTVVAQYGSRLLRVYLGDRTAQLVLGMFVGAFVYCVAAALAIPSTEVAEEAPQLIVTVGLLLILATFASLIVLVQHVSFMLQAPSVAAAAFAQLLGVIGNESSSEGKAGDARSPVRREMPDSMSDADSYPIRVDDTSYIQTIDLERTLELAQEQDLVIRLIQKPGAFVGHGEMVALAWPANRMDVGLDRHRPARRRRAEHV